MQYVFIYVYTIPIGSIYGISTYIWLISMASVGIDIGQTTKYQSQNKKKHHKKLPSHTSSFNQDKVRLKWTRAARGYLAETHIASSVSSKLPWDLVNGCYQRPKKPFKTVVGHYWNMMVGARIFLRFAMNFQDFSIKITGKIVYSLDMSDLPFLSALCLLVTIHDLCRRLLSISEHLTGNHRVIKLKDEPSTVEERWKGAGYCMIVLLVLVVLVSSTCTSTSTSSTSTSTGFFAAL